MKQYSCEIIREVAMIMESRRKFEKGLGCKPPNIFIKRKDGTVIIPGKGYKGEEA